MSCSDYADTPLVLQLDSLLDCVSTPNPSTTESLSSSDMDTPVTIPVEPYSKKVMGTLNNAGWDFNLENVNTFSSPVSLCNVSHIPGITSAATGKGRHRSWMLNYPALCFLVNGKYYSDYAGIFGMMGIQYMSQPQWDKMVAWLGENVTELALASCKQVRQQIIDRGDQCQLKASFDGFYLTRGHHSNNSSATMHDIVTDKIVWFTHRTKRGPGANWLGTSGGAEGDMLSELLTEAKSEGFVISQLVMDHDTSSSNIACEHFPEIMITYCGNHTAKTFHNDLMKIKATRCKVSLTYNTVM